MRIAIVFLLAVLLCGCEVKDPPKSGLKIVCTTGIIADALAAMTPDSCEVIALMGPGTDPHLFKPTKGSLDHMAQADIIFSNGLHLEGRMQDVLKNISRTKPVVFMGDTLPQNKLRYGDASRKMPDPHVWFDVELWTTCVEYAYRELKTHYPEWIDEVKYASYLTSLKDLNQWVKEEIQSIPQDRRVLITAHDAFSYFGKAYDMEVFGLQGISTMAEYGIKDITQMVDMVISREIKSVFVETSVASRSIEAVVAGCKERGYEVTQGGTLYSDALGGKNSGADTYIGMVKANVSTIKNALL